MTEKKSITFEDGDENIKEKEKETKEKAVNVTEQPEKDEPEEDDIEPPEKNEIKFTCPKEKECWDLFNKITQKGIPVSFDTILRLED